MCKYYYFLFLILSDYDGTIVHLINRFYKIKSFNYVYTLMDSCVEFRQSIILHSLIFIVSLNIYIYFF